MKIADCIPTSKLDQIAEEMTTWRLQDGYRPFAKNDAPPSAQNTWCESYFGQFAKNVYMISPRVSDYDPNEFTALGGWCAVRTKDFVLLKAGFLPNLQTGELCRWETVEDVAEWLKNAVSIDQVIEAVGGCRNGKYIVISEALMWAKRVINAIERKLGQELGRAQRQKVEDAIEMAEKKRFTCTRSYLQILTQQRVELFRVVDRDIWSSLEAARAGMCTLAGIDDSKLELEAQYEANIKVAALMWAMYTGFYANKLKELGIMKTQKALIIEPAQHAIAESSTAKRIVQRVLRDKNAYLVPGGANADIGFAAFLEMMTFQGDRIRATKNIGQVPNINNWQQFIDDLKNDSRTFSPDMKENGAFMWGVNMGGLGETPVIIEGMNAIGNDYLTEVKNYASASSLQIRGRSIKSFKSDQKEVYRTSMESVVSDLCGELRLLFSRIFTT